MVKQIVNEKERVYPERVSPLDTAQLQELLGVLAKFEGQITDSATKKDIVQLTTYEITSTAYTI